MEDCLVGFGLEGRVGTAKSQVGLQKLRFRLHSSQVSCMWGCASIRFYCQILKVEKDPACTGTWLSAQSRAPVLALLQLPAAPAVATGSCANLVAKELTLEVPAPPCTGLFTWLTLVCTLGGA